MGEQETLLQKSTVYTFHVPALNVIKVGFGVDGRSRMTSYCRQYEISASSLSLREWKLPSPTIASSVEAACHKALLDSDFKRLSHVIDEREARELFDLGSHSYEDAVIVVTEAIEQTVSWLYEALGGLNPLAEERARQQGEAAQSRRNAIRAEKQKSKEEEEARFTSAAISAIRARWSSDVKPFIVACESAEKLWKQFARRQGMLSRLWTGKQSDAVRLKASPLYGMIKPLVPQVFHTGRAAKSFYIYLAQNHGRYAERAAKELGIILNLSSCCPGGKYLPWVGEYDEERGMAFLEIRLVVQLASGLGYDGAMELMSLDAEFMALVREATAIPAPELNSNLIKQ